MKKLVKTIITVALLMNFALMVQMSVTYADSSGTQTNPCLTGGSQFQVGPQCQIFNIGSKTGLPSFLTGQHSESPGDSLYAGAGTATSPIYYALDLFRFIMSSIAMVMVIVSAFRMVSSSQEEEITKQTDSLKYGIIGLIVIQMATVIVKKMFFGEYGEAFEDSSMAQTFGEQAVSQIRGVVGFINAFIASLAVLVLVVRGFTVIVSGGEEESLAKAKKHMMYAAIGLAVTGVSEFIIRGFVFPDNGNTMPNVDKGKQVLIMFTNYLSGFLALAAFVGLFAAGYLYVTSVGKEDATAKIKNLIISSVIGLVLAMGAFAAVNTFVTFATPQDTSEVYGSIKGNDATDTSQTPTQ